MFVCVCVCVCVCACVCVYIYRVYFSKVIIYSILVKDHKIFLFSDVFSLAFQFVFFFFFFFVYG